VETEQAAQDGDDGVLRRLAMSRALHAPSPGPMSSTILESLDDGRLHLAQHGGELVSEAVVRRSRHRLIPQ